MKSEFNESWYFLAFLCYVAIKMIVYINSSSDRVFQGMLDLKMLF